MVENRDTLLTAQSISASIQPENCGDYIPRASLDNDPLLRLTNQLASIISRNTQCVDLYLGVHLPRRAQASMNRVMLITMSSIVCPWLGCLSK